MLFFIVVAVVAYFLIKTLSVPTNRAQPPAQPPVQPPVPGPAPKPIFHCAFSRCVKTVARAGDLCSFHRSERDAFVKRQCGQKVKHRTQDAAEESADAMHLKTGQRFNAYQCQICRSFHVGHSDKSGTSSGYDS